MMDDLILIVARELLRFAVQRQIACPITGEVLDVANAVLVDATDHGGAMVVVTGEAWDQHEQTIRAKLGGTRADVHDGRRLFGDT
ncbi:hypothetical protein [Actinomadura rupiterrae]|uniref:hypothetical protein n=1 Tax=Actinomadura rupiterrae TaxID=559627 RepID=UPI0020A4029C|nr:hypothetical protein [Actinomadura rupiterrae]MCP2341145.1 hypothetical protein [Actinomadura rupiterrae]